MIHVTVLFFASLRESFGTAQETLTLSEGSTVGEAIQFVLKTHSKTSNHTLPILSAVNSVYASSDQQLTDGDELALMPPVSGG